jgi:hypothetical protein
VEHSIPVHGSPPLEALDVALALAIPPVPLPPVETLDVTPVLAIPPIPPPLAVPVDVSPVLAVLPFDPPPLLVVASSPPAPLVAVDVTVGLGVHATRTTAETVASKNPFIVISSRPAKLRRAHKYRNTALYGSVTRAIKRG